MPEDGVQEECLVFDALTIVMVGDWDLTGAVLGLYAGDEADSSRM